MRHNVLLVLLVFVAGCRAQPYPANAEVIDSRNPLETAARDALLVVDPASTTPAGLYERVHSSGTDSFCAVPVAGSDEAYRIGMVVSFGTTLICEGRGGARHNGDTLELDFDGADCSFTARYDGQSVAMPGVVPAGCSAMCGPRASVSGVTIVRTGWEVGDARRLLSREDGRPLCG